uniref:CTCK domain-containing protein n=2 Tax=Onchocercidae TaxID=6296 RepID=A0A1I8ECN4_WUCBA
MQKTELASTSGSIPVPAILIQTDTHHLTSSIAYSFTLKRYLLITLLLMFITFPAYSAVIKSGCRKHGSVLTISFYSSRLFIFSTLLAFFLLLALELKWNFDFIVHSTQYVIDEPGCDLVAVNVNMCSGYCMSFSFVNPEENSITVHGRCCRMVDNEWVKAKVACEGGDRIMRIPSATECRCFDCA